MERYKEATWESISSDAARFCKNCGRKLKYRRFAAGYNPMNGNQIIQWIGGCDDLLHIQSINGGTYERSGIIQDPETVNIIVD